MSSSRVPSTPQEALTLNCEPIAPAMGACVTGVDLRAAGDDEFNEIRKALLQHIVLVFPGQSLDADDVVRIVRRFGTPISSRTINEGKIKDERYESGALPPEITPISNIQLEGKAIGFFGDSEVVWHSDHSYYERPAAIRMLFGAEVPPAAAGGSTFFMNGYAAFDELPVQLRQRISGKTIKHDNAISITMEVRDGADPNESLLTSKGQNHPIISTHPETGHSSIFLGRRSRAYVNGLSLDESEALLDELWAHSTQPQFCYEHRWTAGDLVVWDNRCTMHRRDPFESKFRRLLLAAQVEGHAPFEASGALARDRHPRFSKGE